MTEQPKGRDGSTVVLSARDGSAMRRSFGWDLAAYGEGYSALCYGLREANSFTATILKCDPICCPQLDIAADLRPVVADERKFLELCCSVASLVVDVPIDLRPLLDVVNRRSPWTPRYRWQLARRPVDHALGGLTPLADRIGWPVARLANLLRNFKGDGPVRLGESLFETYPAADLELIRHNNAQIQRVYEKYRWLSGLKATEPKNWPSWLREGIMSRFGDEMKLTKADRPKLVEAVLGAMTTPDHAGFVGVVKRGFEGERVKITRTDKPPYKGGAARYHPSGWVARGKGWSDHCLADLMNALGFRADGGQDSFDADEFDAVMCSVVGCFPECKLPDDDLRRAIRARLVAGGSTEGIPDESLVPSGYRVLAQWPEKVSLVLKRQHFRGAGELHECLVGLSAADVSRESNA